jgi:hypothetical protein
MVVADQAAPAIDRYAAGGEATIHSPVELGALLCRQARAILAQYAGIETM